MRADQRAVAALNALVCIPFGDLHADTALFKLGGASRNNTAGIDLGNRQLVASLRQNGLDEFIIVFIGALDSLGNSASGCFGPCFRNLDFLKSGDGDVDSIPVLLNNSVALLAIGLLCISLHVFIRLLIGDDVSQLEEGSLHDGVDTSTHADLSGEINSINDVETSMLLGQQLLHGCRQTLVKFFLAPRAVEQEHAAFLQVCHHVIHGHISGIVACDKVSSIDLIRALDRSLAKTQMADGQAAGLLGVIGEISLSIHVCMVTNDLDGVLVGTNSTIGTETIELAADSTGRSSIEQFADGQAGMSQVVIDTNGEMILHFAVEVCIDSLDMGRGEFLAAQTVTATNNSNILAACFCQSSADIQVQRLAQRTGFLGAVQNCDLFHGSGDAVCKHLDGERTIQMDLDGTNLFTHFNHLGNSFISHIATGAHEHDDLFSIGCTDILEGMICTTGDLLNFAHGLFDDGRNCIVVSIGSFTALEIDIRVLSSTGLMRMFRIQSTITEFLDLIPWHDLAEFIIVRKGYFLDFMAGTETIEEMQERYRALQCCNVCHNCHISSFLDRAGCQHRETGLTACHNVTVITENGQSMISQSTCADVEYAGHQLASDLIHVRDHQKQSLRSSKRGGQSTCCQRTMNCACSTSFRLHFGYLYGLSEKVQCVMRSTLISSFRHRGGRSDRINSGHITKSISDMADGSIAIDCPDLSH